MTARLHRAWINQPSALQPLHNLNRTLVLRGDDTPGYSIIYFISGPTISARVPSNTLSDGWPAHLQKD